MWYIRLLSFSQVLVTLLWLSCAAPADTSRSMTAERLESRLTALTARAIQDLKVIPLDSTQIPRSVNADGSLHNTNSHQWTSGFYPGYLWQLYDFSGKPALKTAAQNWTAFIEKEKWDTHTHDLGFKLYSSFGQGWRITQDPTYQDIFVTASQTLIKRYRPTTGAIRSWDFNQEVWQFPVIIDNMINLDMLFAATAATGDSSFYKVAYNHAKTTLKNHYRPDMSSYHVIDYDTLTGDIRNRHTHQGLNNESAWSRGQAWGLYGFTLAYRWTKDPAFLAHAKGIAQFIFHHPNLPEDKIFYWDFDAPNIPSEPRDVSAAAIAAAALLELQQYDPENADQYIGWADDILISLEAEQYQTQQAPYVLQHSVGSVPGGFEIDVPIIYAEYFYAEALLRRLAIEKNR